MLFLTIHNIYGANKTWDGGAGTNNWGDANNWNSNGVPASGDNVVICPNAYWGVTVNLGSDITCANLTIQRGSTLNLNGHNLTVTGGLSIVNQGYISVGSKNLTVNGDFSCDGGNTVISWTSGNVTFGGNVSYSDQGWGTPSFNCTGSGWLIMNGSSKIFTTNNDLSIPNFRLGSSTITKAGSSKLTISNSVDLNNQSSFTQSAGTINVTGTVMNYASMTMAYSGTPTFTYSGGGNIVGGSYYNLTTQTNNISIDCGTTVTCVGTFTNSVTITGSTTNDYFARIVNSAPVLNTGTIGSSSSPFVIAFSGTISGGTVASSVLQNSSHTAQCFSNPKITALATALTGFNYVYDFGPSALQLFVVNGTGLTNPITITPPTDYELSKDGGVTYYSSTSPFTVPYNTSTTVYARLKAGLAIGNYNSENIQLTSGAASQSVTCSGFVSKTSTFIVANGGVNCALNTVNLYSTTSANVSDLYWTGPGSFYSTTANPVITPVTTGTYTLVGSVLSGINLVTNGNFELGNVGFSSDYTYVDPNFAGCYGEHLGCEGNYTVVASPNSVHSAFGSWPDHTPSPGTLQMVINGAETANTNVWYETVTVTPNTNYQFTYWVQSVGSGTDAAPSQLQLYVTGNINPRTPAGPVYTAIAAGGNWKQFVYNWNSGSNVTATLSLVNQQTAAGGNDFALDDISFQAVTQVTASVNVTASSAPALVIASASANPVNTGTMVTFTTIPTNGGSAPAYQWKVNGVNVGINSPTYSYVPLNNDKVTCVMTPSADACNQSAVTSNTITMIVNITPNYWIGSASSTNWNIPTNWSAGFVPAPGDDVVFASPSNTYGSNALNDLYVDDNHTVGNLTNQTTNRKLLISPAKNLVVNQQITSASADRIYIKSDPNLPNGSLIFSATQTGSVLASVEMYSKATYDATGVQDPNTSIWYHYSWQYFGVPLTSVMANPTFYNSFVRSYDETKASTIPGQKWTSLGNTDVLVPFKGYEITQDAPTTILFQGQLVNTDKTISLTNTTAVPAAYDPGQNILSNPYTGAIDIRKLVFDSNTEPTVYLYNTGSFGAWATNTGYSEAGYSSVATPVTPGQYLAIPQSNAGTGSIPYDIPSMSGFLVKVKSGLGTLTIPYSSVITKNVNVQRAPQSQSSTDKKYIEISLHGEHYGDCMWLVEQPGTTRDFDSGWDGYKLSGAVGTPMLFAQEESGNYQISTSDDLNNTYLGFQAGIDLEDTLTFKHENLETKYDGVYLVDLVENKVVDITKSGTQYAFKTETTAAPVKRFKIVTEPYVKNAGDLTTQLKVFNDNNAIYVDNASSEKGELYVYDTMGRCLKNGTFSANNISTFPLFSNSGIYIVKAVTSTEKVSKQIIVKY